jgi:DNA-binding MarR family transcriptional regulator
MEHVIGKPERSVNFQNEFVKNYVMFQYTYVQFFTEHLADCSRRFDGDLQQMLILSIIGQSYLSRYINIEGHPENPPAAMSASRLADVCLIPRETVRRKLKILEDRGWIKQDGEQSWTLVSDGDAVVAGADLMDLDKRAIKRLARMHATFERLMELPEEHKKLPAPEQLEALSNLRGAAAARKLAARTKIGKKGEPDQAAKSQVGKRAVG